MTIDNSDYSYKCRVETCPTSKGIATQNTSEVHLQLHQTFVETCPTSKGIATPIISLTLSFSLTSVETCPTSKGIAT